jgi:transposase
MFTRVVKFKNKDGSLREYVYLLENKRIEGKVKQVLLANLGRLEIVAPKLPGLIENFSKHSKEVEVIKLSQDLEAKDCLEYGTKIIFEKLWDELGLKKWLREYQNKSKIQFPLEKILFGEVLNQILEGNSELSTKRWLSRIHDFGQVELQHLYRGLDFLLKQKDKLEQDLFGKVKDLFNQEVDMILLDTTSISYWGEGKGADDLLDYGYAKNKRFDLKQVIVGIIMTKEGIPIGHEVYKGSTNDRTAFKEMFEIIAERFKIRRVIIVCDRGMVSSNNLSLLKEAGYEYIVGVKMRQFKKEEAKKYLDIKAMEKVKDNLAAKEIIINGKRMIICFNSQQAGLDEEKRILIIERLKEKLKNQGLKSILMHSQYSKYLKIKADKPILDQERIELEKIYDGKFVLQTNTRLSWKEIILSYKDLWQVEAAFKTLKDKLEVGPIFHHKEARIRGHIFVCFLALVLRVVLEKKIKTLDSNVSTTDVIKDLKELNAVRITLKGKEIVLRTEFRGTNHLAFKSLGLAPPSRIISSKFPLENKTVVTRQ